MGCGHAAWLTQRRLCFNAIENEIEKCELFEPSRADARSPAAASAIPAFQGNGLQARADFTSVSPSDFRLMDTVANRVFVAAAM
jgi:hypothetical protein